jgi:ferric-dicitrate binding protein FerR (iron transport regulator)
MSNLSAERIKYLLDQYTGDKASAMEEQELMQWIAATNDGQLLENYLLELAGDESLPPGYTPVDSQAMLDRIHLLKASHKEPVVRRIRSFRSWWAAASIILILATGAFFWFQNNAQKNQQHPIATAKQLPADVAPGHNGAILTLANGKKIVLDSMSNGVVAVQSGAKILLKNDQVSYNNTRESEAVSYNTMSTPRGRQYTLVLSDGSKVWLNAASSITFPTSFMGKERNVEITGEAYFEVAHDAERPFKVKVGDMQVQVLGTHFNVNAYEDEGDIKTTLLEGSVKVSKGNENTLIVPGEQAVILNSPSGVGGITVKKDIDLDEVVAWKNGLFNFNNADLKTVMRQLSRWYNVNIIYTGEIPNRVFGGEMQRDLHLSQVLKLLEKNNVHFKIDGKNIVVGS